MGRSGRHYNLNVAASKVYSLPTLGSSSTVASFVPRLFLLRAWERGYTVA